jgi:Flp pilus assembly protein TadD/O-antigen ligase
MNSPSSRATLFALCATFGLVPLLISWNIYEYALLPKRLGMLVGLSIALACVLWNHAANRSEGSHPGPVGWALFAYAAWAIVSFFATTHPLDSALELCILLSCLGLYIAVARLDRSGVHLVLWSVTLSGLLVSVAGIAQYLGLELLLRLPTNGHPSATFGYRNFAAMFLVPAAPLAAYLSLRSRRRAAALASSLAAGAMALYLVYTRTRGAWLAVLAGGIGFLFCVAATGPRRRAFFGAALRDVTPFKGAVWSITVLAFLLLGSLSPRFVDTGLQRFDEKKADIATTLSSITWEGGDRGRVLMWQNTLDLVADHWLLGVGPGGWQRVYPLYDRGAMIRTDSTPKQPHNDYLWIAAEHGVPALLAYLAALLLALAALARLVPVENSPWTLGAPFFAAALIGTAVEAFFSFPKEQPQALMLLYLLLGISAATRRGRPRPLPRPAFAGLLAVFLCASTAGAYLSARNIAFDGHFLSALLAEDADDWPKVLSEAEAGLGHGIFRPHMGIIHGRALERHQRYEEAASAYLGALRLAPYSWHAHNGLGVVYKRLDRLEEARGEYETALAIYPGAPPVLNNLGALLRQIGDEAGAEAAYRKVLSGAPLDPAANNNMGNLYKERGQLDSAEVSFRRALEAEPDLPQAHHNLADLYRASNRPLEALGHYRKALEGAPREPRIHWGMGAAYEGTRNPVAAEEAYRRAIDLQPEFAQARFSLAELLYGLGRYAESKAAFESFLARWTGDPRFSQFAARRIKDCEDLLRRSGK